MTNKATSRKKKRLGRRTTLSGKKYAGLLADPIPFEAVRQELRIPPDLTAGQHEPDDLRLFMARQEKMSALFAFYEVDEKSDHAWTRLAYRLACAHVPGFQVAARIGAPRKRLGDFAVWRHIDQYLRDKPEKKAADAIRALTKPGRPLAGLTQERVRRIYAARDPEWMKMLGLSAR